MSANARAAAYTLAALCIGAGLVLALVHGGGIALVGIGLLIVASVLLEGRYRGGTGNSHVPPERWVRTGEREIDTETGEPVEVWFDPVTGARRYEPFGRDPR